MPFFLAEYQAWLLTRKLSVENRYANAGYKLVLLCCLAVSIRWCRELRAYPSCSLASHARRLVVSAVARGS